MTIVGELVRESISVLGKESGHYLDRVRALVKDSGRDLLRDIFRALVMNRIRAIAVSWC